MEILLGLFFGILFGLTTGFVVVYPDNIININDECVKNAGLDRVIVNVIGATQVYCKDGAKFTLKD